MSADWLRGKLWIGWPVGLTAWVVWVGSVSYGCWKEQRPVDAEGTPVCVDHLTFLSAAKLVREGRAEKMYDYDFLGRYQGELLGWDWGMLLGYRNPPFYALLYVPTSGLSFVESLLVWNAIGLAALVLAIGWLKPERPLRTLLWSLTFYPVFAVVSFGQNSLLSLAVFAATYRLMAGDRRFLAGLVAGMLWFKPQLLIGLFLWWGFAPRKHLACWLGVATSGAILAAISWLGMPDASQAFVDSLRANLGYGGEKGWNKESPRAFWALLLPGASSGTIWALTAATAAPLIALAWRVSRRSGAEVASMFPVAVFLTLWVSPHSLIYEWAILVPAAIVLWERFPANRDAWLPWFTAAWLVLAASTPLAKAQIDWLKPPGTLQIAIPVMGVVGWVVMRKLVERPRPAVRET